MTNLISAYLAYCRAGGHPKSTIDTYKAVLTMFDRELPLSLEHALEHELMDIIGRERYQPATRKLYTVIIKGFYRYSTDIRRSEHMRLTFDPSEGLATPRVPRGRPRPFSDAERAKVLAEAEEPYLTWMKVVLLTGMRCCEIAGIDLDQGDIDEERVFVRRGKGGKSREIPTDPDLWSLVGGLPGGMLARMPTGQPADARYISIRSALHFRRRLRTTGICLHRGRDTFATDLLDAGVDIRIIQELLGHESLASTQKYTLVRKVQCQTAIRTLHLRRRASS